MHFSTHFRASRNSITASPAAITRPSASTRERLLESRIAELERKVGQLAMENDLLKKAEEFARQKRNASSLIISGPPPSASKRGAKCLSLLARVSTSRPFTIASDCTRRFGYLSPVQFEAQPSRQAACTVDAFLSTARGSLQS